MKSTNPASGGLIVERRGDGRATITVNRPEVRNAFDSGLVAQLHAAVDELAEDPDVRVVVITGAGPVFSAGANVQWLRSMRAAGHEENVADASRMAAMFRALWDLPQPLIGRINGHAFGGGAGLVAVCDVAVAVEGAEFGFTEVRLGIVPAVVSPYAVRKIGLSHARALFTTGERFDAAWAERIGLVHFAVPGEQLDETVDAVVASCLAAGPRAVAVAKQLPERVLGDLDQVGAWSAEITAAVRAGEEGQEGLAAFLEHRPPPWAPDETDGA